MNEINEMEIIEETTVETVENEAIEAEAEGNNNLLMAGAAGAAIVLSGGAAYGIYKLWQKKKHPDQYYSKQAERANKKAEKAFAKAEKAKAKAIAAGWQPNVTEVETVEDVEFEEIIDEVEE